MPCSFCILCGRYIVGAVATSAHFCAGNGPLTVRPENFGKISGKLNVQNGRTRCHPEKIRRGFQSLIPFFSVHCWAGLWLARLFIFSIFIFSVPAQSVPDRLRSRLAGYPAAEQILP